MVIRGVEIEEHFGSVQIEPSIRILKQIIKKLEQELNKYIDFIYLFFPEKQISDYKRKFGRLRIGKNNIFFGEDQLINLISKIYKDLVNFEATSMEKEVPQELIKFLLGNSKKAFDSVKSIANSLFKKPVFKITDHSIEKLSLEEVPSKVRKKLVSIKNMIFENERDFEEKLRTLISEEDNYKFKSRILRNSLCYKRDEIIDLKFLKHPEHNGLRTSKHFIPIVIDNPFDNKDIVEILMALELYGRTPIKLNLEKYQEEEILKWLTEHDLAIVYWPEEGPSHGTSAFPLHHVGIRTRRYLIHQMNSLIEENLDIINPIVTWKTGNEPLDYQEVETKNIPRSGEYGDISEINFKHSSNLSFKHLLIRDLNSYIGNHTVWRRISHFNWIIPQHFPKNTRHMIITALEKEKKAVLNSDAVLFHQPLNIEGLSGLYLAFFENIYYPLFVCCIGEAGRLPAALYAYQVIQELQPKYVIMTGIAGALEKNEPSKGDIVIASKVVDYEYSKMKSDAKENNVKIELREWSQDCRLFDDFKKFIQNRDWKICDQDDLNEVKNLFKKETKEKIKLNFEGFLNVTGQAML